MSNKRPADVDVKQSIKDIFFTSNRYKLDCSYVIRDGKKHPFAVLCPGGGYQMVCSFIEGKPIAQILNKMGISVFILYYRVKKKALYPAPMDDLAQAVREIHDHAEEFGVDVSCYSIWGGSAGGHLAASFGTDHMGYVKYGLPKPGALVLAYPVVTMQRELTHSGSRNWLLGKAASVEQEKLASVEQHVTAAYPPTYVWCGSGDNVVSPENSKMLAAALKKAGVPVQLDIFSDVGHGVGPGTGTAAEGWIGKAVEFWKQNCDKQG